jgi:hypothetical protein
MVFFADSKAADCKAVKGKGCDLPNAHLAQLFIPTALDDAEEELRRFLPCGE